ncbi:hypothetical protein EFQ23_00890 [Limosilactobacillus fermentum]|nr:hypothetical protein [Limosilactobacillus fermentum]PPX65243.1 hypothetical protein C5O28_08590 [Limosilactobacillus fermentum]
MAPFLLVTPILFLFIVGRKIIFLVVIHTKKEPIAFDGALFYVLGCSNALISHPFSPKSLFFLVCRGQLLANLRLGVGLIIRPVFSELMWLKKLPHLLPKVKSKMLV